MQCVVIIAAVKHAPITSLYAREDLAIHAIDIKRAAGPRESAEHDLATARDKRDIFRDGPRRNHANIAV